MELKPQTLMVAIQCVAAEIKRLDKQLENDEVDKPEVLEQTLVSFDLAADELKKAWQAAHQQYGELPAYEELVK